MRLMRDLSTFKLCAVALSGLLVFHHSAAAKPRHVNVSMVDMTFTPAKVEISVGDSVTWTNEDDRDHSVVSADGSFKSGNIGAGKQFSHTFNKVGTVAYGCAYHPRMRGTIIVSVKR